MRSVKSPLSAAGEAVGGKEIEVRIPSNSHYRIFPVDKGASPAPSLGIKSECLTAREKQRTLGQTESDLQLIYLEYKNSLVGTREEFFCLVLFLI